MAVTAKNPEAFDEDRFFTILYKYRDEQCGTETKYLSKIMKDTGEEVVIFDKR